MAAAAAADAAMANAMGAGAIGPAAAAANNIRSGRMVAIEVTDASVETATASVRGTSADALAVSSRTKISSSLVPIVISPE